MQRRGGGGGGAAWRGGIVVVGGGLALVGALRAALAAVIARFEFIVVAVVGTVVEQR